MRLFRKNTGKPNKDKDMGQSSFLEAGIKFTGNIESGGSMRIEGTIDGNIECGERIVLGKQAFVKGRGRAKLDRSMWHSGRRAKCR